MPPDDVSAAEPPEPVRSAPPDVVVPSGVGARLAHHVRVSVAKLRAAAGLLVVQPRVVILHAFSGIGLFALAVDALGLRDLAESAKLSALLSFGVAFLTYLAVAGAAAGLAWHVERVRDGLPRKAVPLRVMLSGAVSHAPALAAWALIAGVVNGLAALRAGHDAVDVVLEAIAMFWQLAASSVISYLVVFRRGLAAAIDAAFDQTARSWDQRLVQRVIVELFAVAGILLAVVAAVAGIALLRDARGWSAVFVLVAVVIAVLVEAWAAAVRFAANLVGRVDERRRSEGR